MNMNSQTLMDKTYLYVYAFSIVCIWFIEE